MLGLTPGATTHVCSRVRVRVRPYRSPLTSPWQQILQCGVGPEPTSEVQAIEQTLQGGPGGMTPLCAQV